MEKNRSSYQMLIMRYIENDMSNEERSKIEIELKRNTDLRKEYDFQTNLNNFLKGKFMSDREEKELSIAKQDNLFNKHSNIDKLTSNWVNEWINNESNINNKEINDYVTTNLDITKKPSIDIKEKNGKTRSLVIALSVAAIIIVAFGLIKLLGKTETLDELYAKNYSPYQFVTEQTRGDDVSDAIVNNAIDSLKAGKAGSAQKLIEQAIFKNSQNAKAQFILASAFMEEAKYAEASAKFNFIINTFDTYRLESYWYLALCYLKLNKPNDAVENLKNLVSTKNYYQNQAEELLHKIKTN